MKKWLLVLLLCFFALPAQAKISSQLLNAVDHIYNANFAQANAIIGGHISSNPNDPAGYLLRGISTEWFQIVNNKGKSFNKKIMADYQKARILATDALEADKNNLDKKVMLGNSYIYVAKKLIDTSHNVQAGSALKKAKNLMEEVLQQNPSQHEAYFAIGLFNYFSENVPPGFKWLAKLLGFNGSRTKGLDYLNKASNSKNLTQGDAIYILVYIFSDKESKYATALKYSQILRKKYPNNPVFLFDEAEMLFRTKKLAESRKLFDEYFTYCASHACKKEYRFLANYFMTWSYMDEKDYAGAKKYVDKANELNTKRFKDRSADLKKWTGILKDK
jgi:tetratricopeptide (TPR) repeat protein